MYYAVALLFAAQTFSLSSTDEQDAIMFAQSRAMPKAFEVCKVATKNVSASEYDAALEKWLKKNTPAVSRGERIMREVAETKHEDFESALSLRVEKMVAELKAYSPAEQAKYCDRWLGIVRSES